MTYFQSCIFLNYLLSSDDFGDLLVPIPLTVVSQQVIFSKRLDVPAVVLIAILLQPIDTAVESG